MKAETLTNSLLLAGINVALVAVAFVCFVFPRFTGVGGILCFLIVLVSIGDALLVLRDLFRSGARWRACLALPLWLPVLFLFGMINQWEGPVYVSANGSPPVFELRGLAGVCGVDIYGPEHENAEWYGDDIGLHWSIDHTLRFPFETKFKYGETPSGFRQVSPQRLVPPLDPKVSYEIVVNRCMGGPQYMSVRRDSISDYKPVSNVCWGALKVSERQSSATVRVDCKTRQPLPMSDRAAARLNDYRENRIPFY